MDDDRVMNQELADAEVELAGADLPKLAAAVSRARHRLFGDLIAASTLSEEPSQLVLAVQ